MIRDLMSQFPRLRLAAGVLAVFSLFGLVLAPSGIASGPSIADSKYIGASKCKNCHKAEESGNQFGKWEESLHAKAFETLASDEAKRIAKEKNIADPQKADECLRCHMTAFGEPEEHIKKGFDGKGVQCEACHGPGEAHMKARMAAAMKGGGGEGFGDEGADAPQQLEAGEILIEAGLDTCKRCHNEESPTFKPFCYCQRVAQIRHLDPRKKRAAEELTVCGCGETCPCEHGARTGGETCCVPSKD